MEPEESAYRNILQNTTHQKLRFSIGRVALEQTHSIEVAETIGTSIRINEGTSCGIGSDTTDLAPCFEVGRAFNFVASTFDGLPREINFS